MARSRKPKSRNRKDVGKYDEIRFPAIIPTRKTGSERLRLGDDVFGDKSLIDFWRWSASDLLSNATRGVFAEFLVASILGIDVSGVREEWAKFDLRTEAGLKIEVKSAAYLQSWDQYEYSSISFNVEAKYSFSDQGIMLPQAPERVADVYILALLKHKIKHPKHDERAVEPMDVSQWCFYVLDRAYLDERKRSQHSISIVTLNELPYGPYDHIELKQRILELDAALMSDSWVI